MNTRRVGLPSDRIQALLDAYADMYGHVLILNQMMAESAPELFKRTPPIPSTEAFIEERSFQKHRGRDLAAARDRMRLHRMRKAQGVYIPKTKGWQQRENAAVETVEQELKLPSKTKKKSLEQLAAEQNANDPFAAFVQPRNKGKLPDPDNFDKTGTREEVLSSGPPANADEILKELEGVDLSTPAPEQESDNDEQK